MAVSGDMVRARSVKAQFDDGFGATPRGGAVLIEQVVRRLGFRRILSEGLVERAGFYRSARVVEQVVEGLLCGGRGFQAAELLRSDASLARIFGHGRIAEEATVYRAMCDLAGLDQRLRSQAYEPAGVQGPRLDMLGRDLKPRVLRRVVGAEPERMDESAARGHAQDARPHGGALCAGARSLAAGPDGLHAGLWRRHATWRSTGGALTRRGATATATCRLN